MEFDSEDNSVIHVSFSKEVIDQSMKQSSLEIKEEYKGDIEPKKQSITQ